MNTDRPLTLVSQEPLLDELLRLAAVAGCELERVSDIVAARRRWGEAPLVLLDEPTARACAEAGLPRRTEIVLLCTGPPPLEVWRTAFAVGAEQVLTLPAEENALLSALADAADRPAVSAGRQIAVLGGRGGAGASVLAATIALTALHRGDGALLVDCDPLGAGIDLVLGAEFDGGLRWPDLQIRGGRVPVSALRSVLPGRSAGTARLAVVSCGRDGAGPTPEALTAVVEAGRRAGDTVVCDLPRNLSSAALAALDRVDLAVLLVPAELRTCAAARRMADRLVGRGVRVEAVVRGPAPGGLRADEVAAAVGVPLLAAVRPEVCLPATLEQTGLRLRSRGPLLAAAEAVLAAVPGAGS